MQNSNFGSIIKKSLKLISITTVHHFWHAKLAKFLPVAGFAEKPKKAYLELPMHETKNVKEYL